MRILLSLLIFVGVVGTFGCSGESTPSTPRKTFETYIRALKQKDTLTMKRLLTAESLKMHEKEAKAMDTTVDDIVKREMIVAEGQKLVEFRNEKIDGERATLEVKNSSGDWETVYFLFEDSIWKIDKKGWADQLQKEIEEEDRKRDEELNLNRPIPFDTASPLQTPPLDSANTDRPGTHTPSSDDDPNASKPERPSLRRSDRPDPDSRQN